MKIKFKKLENLLRELKHPLINDFELQEEIDEINYLLKYNKLYIDEQLIELYLWKGGINGASIYNGEFKELFSGGSFIDIRSANSLLSLDKLTNKIYLKKLPFIQSITGDTISIDLDPKSKTKGQLFILAPAITLSGDFETIYDSIESWIDTIIECYEKKAYILDEQGVLKIDYDLEKSISAKLNPKSEFWI